MAANKELMMLFQDRYLAGDRGHLLLTLLLHAASLMTDYICYRFTKRTTATD